MATKINVTMGSRSLSWEAGPVRSTHMRKLHQPSKVSLQLAADWEASNGSQQKIWSTLAIQKKLLACEPIHMDTNNMEQSKGRILKALQKCTDPASNLNLIDSIQRLGIAHHFEEEIDSQLAIASNRKYSSTIDNLSLTSLNFRLQRQHGYHVSSDVFNRFLDRNGCFNELLSRDTWGMLCLYEASYLGTESDEVLAHAMSFSRNELEKSMPLMDNHTRGLVARSLKLPRHLRMTRLESRDYIDEFSKNCNSLDLLQLAKLDYDMVQSLHQSELAELQRWWKELGLVDRLGFGRDRPTECFLWTVGIFPQPCYSSCRMELAKTICILLVLDDIYDTYGSLNDLILFTDAIKRWDLGAMEELPEYMKICYMALYNTTHEIAYKVLRKHGWSIVEHIKRTWFDIFEAFQTEANWFHRGYTPKLNEYLSNGVTSAGSYMALVHAFFLMGQGVTKRTLSMLDPYPRPFQCAGEILRLWDDLGTSSEEQERGDVSSSVQCYMEQEGAVHELEARNCIKQRIGKLWMELNGYLIDSTFLPLPIVNASLNLARTAQTIYQQGDDKDLPSVDDQVQRLLFTPLVQH